MTFHIGYDREEDKIELILASQGNVISTLVYHIVRTTSGIAISTYLATRRLPPPTPPFACCCHPLSFYCRRVILLIIECIVHY